MLSAVLHGGYLPIDDPAAEPLPCAFTPALFEPVVSFTPAAPVFAPLEVLPVALLLVVPAARDDFFSALPLPCAFTLALLEPVVSLLPLAPALLEVPAAPLPVVSAARGDFLSALPLPCALTFVLFEPVVSLTPLAPTFAPVAVLPLAPTFEPAAVPVPAALDLLVVEPVVALPAAGRAEPGRVVLRSVLPLPWAFTPALEDPVVSLTPVVPAPLLCANTGLESANTLLMRIRELRSFMVSLL
jgi:hypothetical protein